MAAKVEKVLILTYTKLPKHLKEYVEEMHMFGNDRYLKHWNKLEIDEMTQEGLEAYYADQVSCGFNGTLEDLIDEDGLHIEKWLIDEKIDLTGVTKILIHVCW